MFKFLQNQFSGRDSTEEISDFLQYVRTVRHGFPDGVTAFALDDHMGLLAVGNSRGEVSIFGVADVMWHANLPAEHLPVGRGREIAKMYFCRGTGILIVLTQDASLIRFKIVGDSLVVNSCVKDGRIKKITSCCVHTVLDDRTKTKLLMGSSSGNVYSFDIYTMEQSEFINYAETLKEHLPESPKSDVTLIDVSPIDPNIIVIVMNGTSVVKYSIAAKSVVSICEVQSVITCSSWSPDGQRVMLGHNDGFFTRWQVHDMKKYDDRPILFGPFPCTKIKKVYLGRTERSDADLQVLIGGLPRALYGDRYTMAVKHGRRGTVFDFTNPVLDMVVHTTSAGYGSQRFASAIFVLTENEVICIDIIHKDWKVVEPICLHPLHASPVTTTHYCGDIDEHTWNKMMELSKVFIESCDFSKRMWPLKGGQDAVNLGKVIRGSRVRQVWLTGHENGDVKVWSAGHTTMKLLFIIKTSIEFKIVQPEPVEMPDVFANKMDESIRNEPEPSYDDDDNISYDDSSFEDKEQEFPAFTKKWESRTRQSYHYEPEVVTESDLSGGTVEIILQHLVDKEELDNGWTHMDVGVFDPFSDDVLLAISKLYMDPKTGQIVVGGKGGQVLLYNLVDKQQDLTPDPLELNVMPDSQLVKSARKMHTLTPRDTLHQYPPGYQPFNFPSQPASFLGQLRPPGPITALGLLSYRDLLAVGNDFGYAVVDYRCYVVHLAQTLSNDQELRSSGLYSEALSRFRTMKQSIRQTFRRKGHRSHNATVQEFNTSGVFSDNEDDLDTTRPVERRIEERGQFITIGESPPGSIKVLKFLNAPVGGSAKIDTLWVGTNGGRVLIFAINEIERNMEPCRLVREIRMDHGAPIVNIELTHETSGRSIGFPKVIIFTEEQVRSYSLPNLKAAKYKFKLTSTEGTRIRKTALVELYNGKNLNEKDHFAVLLTNMGEISVHCVTNPKKRVKFGVLRNTDIVGISSTCISPYGELFYLRNGASEIQRALISSHSHPYQHPMANLDWPFKD